MTRFRRAREEVAAVFGARRLAGATGRERAAGSRLSTVNWPELHARIEDVGRVLAAGRTVTPEQTARILAERARALATPLRSDGEAQSVELLMLELGGNGYALETRFVIEVVRHPPIAPLPGATAPVAAVAAWRGRILTALDLRPPSAAGLSAAAAGSPLLVVVGGERAELGLLVDDAESISEVPLDRLRPVPEGSQSWRDYLRAITDDAVPVLDGEALLRRHHADR